MSKSLIDRLDTLPDFRRNEGKRHKISTVIIIAIMSIVSKSYSLRGMAEFAKIHNERLSKILKLKHGTPAFNVIRNVLQNIDFDKLNIIIQDWLIDENLISPNEWFGIDGKCICSTISDVNNVNQNFVSIVTLFSHKTGISLLSGKYENKKTSEIEIVQNLINSLNLQGATITSDALNSQKKL